MSSVLALPRKRSCGGDGRRSTGRRGHRHILSLAIAILPVVLYSSSCLNRQPAPEGPVPPIRPFEAVCTWRGIRLPEAPAEARTQVLPETAGRLAVGPSPDTVYADTALLDGPDSAVVAEDWKSAKALISGDRRLWILLVDASLWRGHSRRSLCERLGELGGETRVAVAGDQSTALGPWCPPPKEEHSTNEAPK